MKKSTLRRFEYGSAEYVFLHGRRACQRGRRPSLPFRDERNPQKAFALAAEMIHHEHFYSDSPLAHVYYLRSDNHEVGAEIILDHFYQIDAVILSPDISAEIKLDMLRQVASHVTRYWISRHHVSGPFVRRRTSWFSHWDSTRAFKTYRLSPELEAMDAEQITEALGGIRVEVVDAVTYDSVQAIEKALDDVRLHDVQFHLGPRSSVENSISVRFRLTSDRQFRAWHDVGRGRSSSFDLYIVPAYHPTENSKRSIGLVNGDTGALIANKTIAAAYPPFGSLLKYEDSFRLYSWWDRVNHPFYAAGTEIKLDVMWTRIRSAKGIQELRELLLGLLEEDDTYLGICGGFSGPLPRPRRKPGIGTGDGVPRGSEGFCVWAYRVLKEEGELERAHIPSWFGSEGWLKVYESYSHTTASST